MNYGRFFRLNQALSKVVSGIAIYDYIDLPAYFGPSIDNPMSPKYPISVTITSDSICFRLHYSAFKLDKGGDSDFPQYAYDKDDIDKKAQNKMQVEMGMAHMEEIVLELPFSDISSSRLSDTIKNIYNSTFPQVIDENTSMGGRYLEQLIKKRYPIEKDKESENGKDSVEDILYRNLRKMSDETDSFSTLWLMDLVREDRIYLYSKQKVIDDKTKKEKEIDVIKGFLRKLLLDFMFDMKHSDVFQNSACYQKMYSGLMSDFYFSALMHKCDYYYHRKQIREAVNKKEYDRDTIVTLYAEELFRAEELWVKDITSSQAEDTFEYFYDKKHFVRRELNEDGLFNKYPSWFADPEEEMRRVCFTMREKGGTKERHMCNMDVLIKLLDIRHDEMKKDFIESKMVKMRNDNQKLISQWFLKRYDFKDLFHLHLYKYANSYLVAVLVISLFLLMPFVGMDLRYIALCGSSLFFFMHLFRWFYIYQKDVEPQSKIDSRRNKITLNRIKGTCFFSGLLVLFLSFCFYTDSISLKVIWDNLSNMSLCSLIVLFSFIFIPLFIIIPWKKMFNSWNAFCSNVFPIEPKLQHVMSNLHLLFPRLVASITASWITISMGFDLYVSFFDATPAWATVFVLLAILLLFVMFEINKVTPNSNSWIKLFRSIELIVISYAISLIIGIVVINFLGERYLEKGGYVGDGTFNEQYVETKNGFGVFDIDGEKSNITFSSSTYKQNVAKLDSVFHINKRGEKSANYSLVEHVYIFSGELFVLRNFLVMFAFIAMFMGIFIQIIIFGDSNKQMTEL